MTEGRIVYAGALADQGRLPEALALLRKRAERIKKPGEHQLRLWYALADLEERAGNLARARELFHEVRRADAVVRRRRRAPRRPRMSVTPRVVGSDRSLPARLPPSASPVPPGTRPLGGSRCPSSTKPIRHAERSSESSSIAAVRRVTRA